MVLPSWLIFSLVATVEADRADSAGIGYAAVVEEVRGKGKNVRYYRN